MISGLEKLRPYGVFVPIIVTVSVVGTSNTPRAVGADNVRLNARLVCTRLLAMMGTMKVAFVWPPLKVMVPLVVV